MKSQMKKKQTMKLVKKEKKKSFQKNVEKKRKLEDKSDLSAIESDIDNLDDINSFKEDKEQDDASPQHIFRVGGQKPQILSIEPLLNNQTHDTVKTEDFETFNPLKSNSIYD